MTKRLLARRIAGTVVVGGLCLGAGRLPVMAQSLEVVPQELTTVEGNTSTDIPFAPLTLSLLQYIPASANGNVAGLTSGDIISGLRFRTR